MVLLSFHDFHMKKSIHIVGSLLSLPPTLPSLKDCDIIEIRLEAWPTEEELTPFLEQTPHKKLLTARASEEGGARHTTLAEREALLTQYLPHAAYIDVEMRNWHVMQQSIQAAQSLGITTIASYHDFTKTPKPAHLEKLFSEAQSCGADIVKFAFMTDSLQDIQTCQSLLESHPESNISIMGMGAYAPVSRVLLAQAGSVLNYGFLGEQETAPGQWHASLLKKAITHSASLM